MNYEKLEEKILKKYKTKIEFAKAMGWCPATVTGKLNGRVRWTCEDISKARTALGLSQKKINEIFFPEILTNCKK